MPCNAHHLQMVSGSAGVQIAMHESYSGVGLLDGRQASPVPTGDTWADMKLLFSTEFVEVVSGYAFFPQNVFASISGIQIDTFIDDYHLVHRVFSGAAKASSDNIFYARINSPNVPGFPGDVIVVVLAHDTNTLLVNEMIGGVAFPRISVSVNAPELTEFDIVATVFGNTIRVRIPSLSVDQSATLTTQLTGGNVGIAPRSVSTDATDFSRFYDTKVYVATSDDYISDGVVL